MKKDHCDNCDCVLTPANTIPIRLRSRTSSVDPDPLLTFCLACCAKTYDVLWIIRKKANS